VSESLLMHGRALRRRNRVNRLVEVSSTVAALLAVAVLLIVVGSVLLKGLDALSIHFLTTPTALFGEEGGGISNAIIGTGIVVAIAAAMAIPVGILVAIFTTEFAPPRIAHPVRFVLDVLNGVPTIVTGIFVFGLMVEGNKQSGYAASVALAIIMLPLVARSAQEVLALVPEAIREASFALGVSRWRTVLGVILPTTFGGILTGATLAIARAAGETAPLLFTSALVTNQISWDPRHALQSIPLVIFEDLEQPDPALHAQAWGAALVLMAFVLVVSAVSKAFLARSRRKLSR
jgi:phosphate transport system permease protein